MVTGSQSGPCPHGVTVNRTSMAGPMSKRAMSAPSQSSTLDLRCQKDKDWIK
jgi:hypothetical protein